MKQLTILFLLSFLFSMSACNEDNESPYITETGTVIDLTGNVNCGIIIELDNGKRIQPLYYPEEFTFSAGQRVLVDYVVLNKVLNSCGEGIPCEISYVEELSCASFIELDKEGTPGLTNDPVHIQEAFVDGNCLYIKLSYSGGCKQHSVDLALILTEGGNTSDVPVFEIRHDANDDLCEAWITREFRFDISELRAEGKNRFRLEAPLSNNGVYSKTFELN